MQPRSSHQIKCSFLVSGLDAAISEAWHLMSNPTSLGLSQQELRTTIFGISPEGLLPNSFQAFKWLCPHHFFPKSEEKLGSQHSTPFPFICPYLLLLASQKSRQTLACFLSQQGDVPEPLLLPMIHKAVKECSG